MMAKKDKIVPLEATRNIDSETTNKKDVEITKKETYDLIEAEQLQNDGWRLLGITQTSNGKIYKFER
jgi:hypothetical protein